MKKLKRPSDPNQLAHLIVGLATGSVKEPFKKAIKKTIKRRKTKKR